MDTPATTENVPISKKLVLINSASTLAARAINIGVLVWLQQYLLRRLSAEEFSLYPVLWGVMAFTPLLTVVLTGSIGRYVVAAYAVDDKRRVTQIISTMLPLLVVATAVLALVGAVFTARLDRVLTIDPGLLVQARWMMGLFIGSFLVTLITAPLAVGLYVRQKFVWLNLIDLGQQLLRIGLLFALLLGVSTSVLWVAVAHVAAAVLAVAVRVVISQRLMDCLRFRRDAVHWPVAGELLSFGVWNFLRHTAGAIRNGAVPIILNKFATASDVNCFHLGSLFRRQTTQVWRMAAAPLTPVLTAMHAAGETGRVRSTHLRGGRYALWVAMLIATPLMVFRHEFFALYTGPEYAAAATVTLLLLAVFPLELGNALLGSVVFAMGRLRPHAWRVLVMQTFNVGLTLVLVWPCDLGAVGAAIATLTMAAIFEPLLMWTLGLKILDMSFARWLRESLIPGLVPAAGGAAVWLALHLAAPPQTWPALIGCCVAGAVAYGIVWALWGLRPGDRREIAQLFAAVTRRFRRSPR